MKSIPKRLELVFHFYPSIHFILVFSFAFMSLTAQNKSTWMIGLVFVAYFLSPLIWRGFLIRFGLPEGYATIGKKAEKGNLWLVSYQLQQLYNSFHFFETALKIFPGLYSCWLRLWGAKIGEKVNWTPGSKIVDRSHIEIGDKCLIGNLSYLSSHALKKKGNTYFLYLKKIKIQAQSVVSYHTTVSPGVIMKEGSFLAAGGVLYPNKVLEKGESFERFQELSQ